VDSSVPAMTRNPPPNCETTPTMRPRDCLPESCLHNRRDHVARERHEFGCNEQLAVLRLVEGSFAAAARSATVFDVWGITRTMPGMVSWPIT